MAAITLSIELTDQQRAILEAHAPGDTNVEKRDWATGVAKRAIRREVSLIRRAQTAAEELARLEAERAAIAAEQAAAAAAIETDWPE